MNEELTNEVLEALNRCNGADCHGCPAQKICRYYVGIGTIQALATALLEERAKPKVWDGAPEWVNAARVRFFVNDRNDGHSEVFSETYTREPPKTRIDEIIDESLDGWLFEMRMGKSEMREILKSALNKYAEELTKKETN